VAGAQHGIQPALIEEVIFAECGPGLGIEVGFVRIDGAGMLRREVIGSNGR